MRCVLVTDTEGWCLTYIRRGQVPVQIFIFFILNLFNRESSRDKDIAWFLPEWSWIAWLVATSTVCGAARRGSSRWSARTASLLLYRRVLIRLLTFAFNLSTYSLTRWLTCLITCLLTRIIFTNQLTHLLTYPLTHSLTYSLIQSNHHRRIHAVHTSSKCDRLIISLPD